MEGPTYKWKKVKGGQGTGNRERDPPVITVSPGSRGARIVTELFGPQFLFPVLHFRRPPANILCAPLITIIRLAAFSLTARCHYCHAVVVRFTSCHPLNATKGCGEWRQNKQAVRARPLQYAPARVTLTFDLTIVSESCVTWATSVPILVFLGLSVLDLGPVYATDRQTSDSIIA